MTVHCCASGGMEEETWAIEQLFTYRLGTLQQGPFCFCNSGPGSWSSSVCV